MTNLVRISLSRNLIIQLFLKIKKTINKILLCQQSEITISLIVILLNSCLILT